MNYKYIFNGSTLHEHVMIQHYNNEEGKNKNDYFGQTCKKQKRQGERKKKES